jgi:formate dehydrogenase iron-sulfur subunit
MSEKSILYDATRCTACRGCQVACKQWNETEGEKTVSSGSYENPPDLSPKTWLKIEFKEIEKSGKVRFLFNRRACMHCTDAACIKVCPDGSVFRNEQGYVSYNKDTCTGCGYCYDFCPFKVPRFNRNVITGQAKMDKCTLCTTPGADRLDAGLEPACVKTCPTEALIYGDRDALLTDGKNRVELLKSKGYQNAYLYGEKELDGLHVMYVLDESPEIYGLPASPQAPASATALKDILRPVSLGVGVLAVAGLGLNFLIARKAKMKHDSLKNKKG